MTDVDPAVDSILGRAETPFPGREIVTKRPEGSLHRYTYRKTADRVRQLATAPDEFGVDPGGRVGTVALNSYRHLELYFAPGRSGRSIHTCNMRPPDGHFRHAIADAGDEALFVDPAFVGTVEADADDPDAHLSAAFPKRRLPDRYGFLDGFRGPRRGSSTRRGSASGSVTRLSTRRKRAPERR